MSGDGTTLGNGGLINIASGSSSSAASGEIKIQTGSSGMAASGSVSIAHRWRRRYGCKYISYCRK